MKNSLFINFHRNYEALKDYFNFYNIYYNFILILNVLQEIKQKLIIHKVQIYKIYLCVTRIIEHRII